MIGLEYIVNLYNYQFKDIAEQLGVSKQVVNGWIKERYKISSKHLPKLATIFNVPEKYFQKELTELEKLEIQNLKISNEVIKHEIKDTSKEKIKEILIEGVDITSLRFNDLQKKQLIMQDNISKVLQDSLKIKPELVHEDEIDVGNYIVNLFEMFTEIIKGESIRLDVIHDILIGMQDCGDKGKKPKRNSYTKKITKGIDKEQLIRDEADRINLKQEQDNFTNEELNRYEEEQQLVSKEEKQKREMISKLFK
ncbi:helix-turn-helix transcriptional regulator [uncultured Clostridium sp.]|uniref:helix-turn-helix domain-containing protein n=1 Tax=uncultured Clostridium sp. TaxID=59620 RepID=UPI0025EDE289|nr:helix-turn-helix transcriptional regulator [uncultured Clostridium sp.]